MINVAVVVDIIIITCAPRGGAGILCDCVSLSVSLSECAQYNSRTR